MTGSWQVRLADAVSTQRRHAGYARQAHLDFVMVDAATSVPRFAVEFDGRQHFRDQDARRRDQLKDAICEEAGLPLLRITSEYTQTIGRWVVLTYVVDSFYLSDAFDEAQHAGLVPLDEPLSPALVWVPDGAGGTVRNALDVDARQALWQLGERSQIPAAMPDVFITRDRSSGAVHADAFLAVAPDRYLIAQTRIRDYIFRGLSAGEVAEQLVVVEMAELARSWVNGKPAACNQRDLRAAMAAVQARIDHDGFSSAFTSTAALSAGGPLEAAIVLGPGLGRRL